MRTSHVCFASPRSWVATLVTRRVQHGRNKTKLQVSLPTQKVPRHFSRESLPRRDPAPAGVAKKGRTRAQALPPRFSIPPRENAQCRWPWTREQKLSGGALASSAAVAPARTARASLLEEEEKGRENRVTRWRMCSTYCGGRASELWGAKGGEGGCVWG